MRSLSLRFVAMMAIASTVAAEQCHDKAVTVALWHTKTKGSCDIECETTKTQWSLARELFNTVGVNFVEVDFRERGKTRLRRELRESQSQSLPTGTALTLHYNYGDALVVRVSLGAEVSLGLNSLCRTAPPRFPDNVMNAMRILRGQGQMPLAEALRLAWDANLNAWNPLSTAGSPFLTAASDKDEKLLYWLLEVGADHTTRNEAGDTALHLAVRGSANAAPKSLNNAVALLDAGASLEARNHLGETPLHVALQEWPNTFLSQRNGVKNYFNQHVELFLKHGAPVDARDARDQTPLHIAVSHHNTRGIVLLLQHGASPCNIDVTNSTAFHYVVNVKWIIKASKELLNTQEDPKSPSFDDMTVASQCYRSLLGSMGNRPRGCP